MPRGDRTGPMGAGPRTGRGAGWCAGYDRPGYAYARPGFGFGMGYGGRGRGWRNMFHATGRPGWARGGFVPPMPEAEPNMADLKAEASWLASRLDAIQKRIEDLEGRGAAPAAS